jgi:hypothetical protein
VTIRTRQVCVAVVIAGWVCSFSADARADAAVECLKNFEDGVASRERGKLRDARKHFVACAADACPKALRIDCARGLDEVDASLPTIVFGAKDARGADLFDVNVLVDGERVVGHEQGKAVALDPGPHVIRFERPSAKPVEERVLLRAGEHNRPMIARFLPEKDSEKDPLAPKKPERPQAREAGVPTATIVLGALGLSAMGSFTFFAVTGSDEKDRLRTSCAPGCTDDQIGGLRTRYVLADVSLGVGIVALGLAAYLWLTAAPQRR